MFLERRLRKVNMFNCYLKGGQSFIISHVPILEYSAGHEPGLIRRLTLRREERRDAARTLQPMCTLKKLMSWCLHPLSPPVNNICVSYNLFVFFLPFYVFFLDCGEWKWCVVCWSRLLAPRQIRHSQHLSWDGESSNKLTQIQIISQHNYQQYWISASSRINLQTFYIIVPYQYN